MTKIAYGSESVETLRQWVEGQARSEGGAALMTTRYLPKRHEEMVGGSLYWIHEHVLVARSPILCFEQRPDCRWWIRLEPRLIPVEPRRKRAHQGWRYLAEEDAPADLESDTEASDRLPGRLIGELSRLGLV